MLGLNTKACAAAIVGLAVVGAAGTASAAVVLTNEVGSGADASLGNDSGFDATTNTGAGSAMELRANDGSGTNRNRLGIIRFDLSGIMGDLSGAELQLWETGNNSRTVSVYGLLDGDAGETWDESTISYSTAPAISLTTGSSGGPATSFDPVRTVLLGTFGTTSSTAETVTFSAAALDTFLANDTNDLVTLYLYRDGGGSVTVRTKENGTPPTLSLPNAVIPEPASLALAALGGLVVLGRRRS